jgi:hypothetical protein
MMLCILKLSLNRSITTISSPRICTLSTLIWVVLSRIYITAFSGPLIDINFSIPFTVIALSSSYQKWGYGQVLSWHSIQTILFMYPYRCFQQTHDQICCSKFIFTCVLVISSLPYLITLISSRHQIFVRSAEFSAKVNLVSILPLYVVLLHYITIDVFPYTILCYLPRGYVKLLVGTNVTD